MDAYSKIAIEACPSRRFASNDSTAYFGAALYPSSTVANFGFVRRTAEWSSGVFLSPSSTSVCGPISRFGRGASYYGSAFGNTKVARDIHYSSFIRLTGDGPGTASTGVVGLLVFSFLWFCWFR